jgi:hypothetical protein
VPRELRCQAPRVLLPGQAVLLGALQLLHRRLNLVVEVLIDVHRCVERQLQVVQAGQRVPAHPDALDHGR